MGLHSYISSAATDDDLRWGISWREDVIDAFRLDVERLRVELAQANARIAELESK